MTHDAPNSRHFILGAAGHVDHGKTALITALTGTNTDRLKEEQERGISIELGFAELDLGGGVTLGVVDMPGHERFVRQMVAGAGGVDLAFLLVAADEGVMPQTVEHLAILNSLGVRGGVVVISKIDMVDAEIAEVAAEEARDLVAGTFLAGRPVVLVSAHKGLGLDDLRDALRAEALALPLRGLDEPFRLPVDRVFTMPGAGAIVTGTCWSGQVRVGDQLVVEPGALKVRVREVQEHGRHVEAGAAGMRLALALHGVKKEDLERGFQVVTPGADRVTRRIDLRVDLFPHYRGELKNRQRLHVNHAGREVLGRIVLLDADEMGGDTGARSGICQLHLEAPIVARRGDRLVLRFYSPVTSIAGGTIVDTEPRRHRRFDEDALERLEVLETGDPAEVFRQQLQAVGLVGLSLEEAGTFADDVAAVRVGKRLYDRDLLDRLARDVSDLIAEYARRFPLRLGLPREEARQRGNFAGAPAEWAAMCQAMGPLGGWVMVGDRLAATPEGPRLAPEVAAAIAAREDLLRQHGLQWPGATAWAEAAGRTGKRLPPDQKEEEALRHLVDHGRAVQVAPDYFVHGEALTDLLAKLRASFAASGDLAFGTFREVSGLSRKLGIPMLEYLDETGYTRRDGDVRRPGPRLEATAQT
jgi:selenocysteine-specific elongation factor